MISRLKLTPKLLSAVVFLVLVSAAITAMALRSLWTVEAAIAEMKTTTERLSHAGRGTSNMLAFFRAAEFLPLEMSADERQKTEATARDELRRMRARIDRLDEMVFAEAGKRDIVNIRATTQRYEAVFERIVAAGRSGDLKKASVEAIDGGSLADEIRAALRRIETRNDERLVETQRSVVEASDQAEMMILIVAGLGGLIGISLSLGIVMLGVTRPIGALTGVMGRLAKGETDVEIPGADRGDEIGDMGKAVMVFRDNAIERARLEAAETERQAQRAARQARVDDLIFQFRSEMAGIVSTVADGTRKMNDTAGALSAIAGEASGRSGEAARASEEASTNVQTVASASEELSASIREIAQQISHARDVVSRANTLTDKTNSEVGALAEAANKIGQVVGLIRAIAEQTNLLALNATIEAARAGESGKGFAVVAAEVKNLAAQTARATEEIAAQVTGIQSATGGAVEAIRSISGIVGEINEATTVIAAAVEEQGAATSEIARNIQMAAAGTEMLTSNVAGVTGAIGETSGQATIALDAATSLDAAAVRLRQSVEGFLTDVAAA